MGYANEQILKKSGEVFDYTVKIRREIHKHPEIGMQEFKTSGLICAELDKMGIPYRKNVGGTGVVGLIKGDKEGNCKVIGLRADMDALTIQEKNDVPYASEIPGIMHACGHDGHVAMLLGAAKVLNDMKSEFSGSVKLLFQPAEEGPGGAEPMIRDGALKNPDVDAVFGFHLSSHEATGIISSKPGPFHAAHDEFEIIIKGEGGHAAYPHQTVDAIVMAAEVITSLQTIVSRKIDPLEPVVITVGVINGGERHNVIADRVELKGTIRYFDDSLRMKIRKWIDDILKGVTGAAGGSYEIEYIDGYPAMVNNPELYKEANGYLNDLLGEDNVLLLKTPTMGAEDFAYFCNEVPSLFLDLGSGGKNGEFGKPHHHPQFDVDEDAFVPGVASLVKIALEFLK